MIRLIPIISAVLLLFVIVGGIFIIRPQYESFQTLSNQLDNLKIDLEQKQEYYAKINEINNNLEQYKDEIAKIDSAIPTDPSAAALWDYFVRTAPENGLIVKKIDQGITATSAATDRVQKIPILVSLVGSYSGFKNFLGAVYRSSRIIEVESIKIVPPTKGGDDFSFDLALRTHAYKTK